MEQYVSVIFLAVADLSRSRRFYEQGLGWVPPVATREGIAYYQLGGIVLAFSDDVTVAADVAPARSNGGEFRGVLLAHNVRARADVDAILARAENAGAHIVRPAAETDWGGYTGTFSDPDRHAWEIAWNPHFALRDDGSVRLSAGGGL
jgi:uncharacterized protein